MNVKTLRLPLFFSLLILLVPLISARADDQVTIKIQMEGDAYVEISNSNGTIVFNYNGKNIMPSLQKDVKWLKVRANSNKLAIYLIRRDLHRLIRALNNTFGDLYGKVYYTAKVTGIAFNHNNSTVLLQLQAGNMTLVDFIDQLLNTTEKQNLEIKNLQIRVSSNKNETKKELNRIWTEISSHKSKLERLNDKFDQLQQETAISFSKLYDQYRGLKLRIEKSEETYLFTIAILGIFDLFMVIMLVWIAGWKAKKT